MFSTLRKGQSIYVLDRTNEPEVKLGYIENVSMPRPMYPTYNPAVSMGTNMQTVVDIKTRIDDETKEFVVPSNLSVHTYGNYTISENKEAMISEVDSLLQDVTTKIENIDKYKEDAEGFKKILKDLNPVYAKEQERDEAISELNTRMDNLQDVISRLDSFLRRNETSLTN